MTDLVTLELAERDGVVVARLAGELDIAGTPGTRAEIERAVPVSARGLIVDCSELSFIDSSGVAMLFGLARHLGGRRQQLRVVAPRGKAVARVLEIVEFERAAPIVSDAEAGVRELAGQSGGDAG